MKNILRLNLNYNKPVEISDGIFWIGYYDKLSGLRCNPYIIIDNDEAVIIDGGSRPDFPEVMLKVMQTGMEPSQINALIYQHYDPDVCGSVSNFEDLIGNIDLKLISDVENYAFIKHYAPKSPLLSLEEINHEYVFKSGRKLLFFNTPYSHSQGNFITFDTKEQVLFTSDLFGNMNQNWELFLSIDNDCRNCEEKFNKFEDENECILASTRLFHKNIMTSTKALRFALDLIRLIPAKIIAPQHGSIISGKEDGDLLIDFLYSIEDIGIDAITDNTNMTTQERLRKNGF